MLLHPLQYGSGTDPTFSHRGLVQKLPVGISTKESHSDFWHHLLGYKVQPTFQGIGNFNFTITVVDFNTSSTRDGQLKKK